MGYFGPESKRVSPYRAELADAKCIQLLANYVSLMQVSHGEEVAADSPAFQALLADVEAVRCEYDATPDDVQWALEVNDRQLIIPHIDT